MKPRILIVDDDAPARELYSLFLRAKGFDVMAAANSIEAMAFAQQHRFDAAVFDLSLKDYNGLNLIKPMKEIQPQLPILIYTGRTMTEALMMDAYNRGACALLSKTQSLPQLIEVLKKNITPPESAAPTPEPAAPA